MAAYTFSGDEAELTKIINENRIRVEWGLITITPVDGAGDTKETAATDTKDVTATDTKKPRSKKKS